MMVLRNFPKPPSITNIIDDRPVRIPRPVPNYKIISFISLHLYIFIIFYR